jgi:small subunit ribosomal protein S6
VNNYLLTLVFKTETSDEARKSLVDGVKKKALGGGGKVVKEDEWGARDLAYPIKHFKKGFYIHMELETDPKNVRDLDKVLKVEDDILRYLLVRV